MGLLAGFESNCEIHLSKILVGLPARLRVQTAILVASIVLPASANADPPREDLNPVRVAGIVLKWIPGKREANFHRAEHLIRKAAADGAHIVATAESFLDGYSVRDQEIPIEQLRSLAEPIPNGPYFSRLLRLADELDIYLVPAISEIEGTSVYNSAALIGPDGSLLGRYRKKLVWPGEAHLYKAGTDLRVFDTPLGRIGLMVCFDRMHPEAVQELADKGADLVINPSGGSWGPKSQSIMKARSEESRLPIVFIHPLEFLVTGSDGSVLALETRSGDLDDPRGRDGGETFYVDLHLNGRHSP